MWSREIVGGGLVELMLRVVVVGLECHESGSTGQNHVGYDNEDFRVSCHWPA